MFQCCRQSSHGSQNEKRELWAALHLCVLVVLSGQPWCPDQIPGGMRVRRSWGEDPIARSAFCPYRDGETWLLLVAGSLTGGRFLPRRLSLWPCGAVPAQGSGGFPRVLYSCRSWLPSTQLVLPCLQDLGGCGVPEPITWWLEMVQLPVFFWVTLMAGMLPGGSPRPGSPWLIRRAGILV